MNIVNLSENYYVDCACVYVVERWDKWWCCFRMHEAFSAFFGLVVFSLKPPDNAPKPKFTWSERKRI